MIVGFLSVCWALVSLPKQVDLTIDNFQPADIVRYPLVIVNGSAEGPEMAIGTSWKTAIRFPVVNHRYSSIVELKPGINMVLLHSGKASMKFRLDYKPMTSPYRVQAIYVMASDEAEAYFTDNPKDRFPIREKFDTEMKLLQSFTADAMNRAGYGRKTFPLELDGSGKVAVHFVKSPMKGDALRALDANAIYSHVYDVLKTQFTQDTSKWCGLLGFTRYDVATKKALGHLALGGGCQGLFGSGSMQWWPATLKDVPKVFTNTTVLDPNVTFEDSGYRKTVWANVSTAFGATIHELGHTFGLPHSADRFSVMSRGFDFFSRSFTVVEPPVAGKTDPTFFASNELSSWDLFSAAHLNVNPWFQPDGYVGTAFDTSNPPAIKVSEDEITISATNGIRVVGAHNDAIPEWFAEYKALDAPKQLKLSIKEIRSKMQNTGLPLEIVVIDSNGNQSQVSSK